MDFKTFLRHRSLEYSFRSVLFRTSAGKNRPIVHRLSSRNQLHEVFALFVHLRWNMVHLEEQDQNDV